MYPAADFILVPSMFEPRLTQMISMRYGAVPVVRATGGLRDTIFDVDTEKGRAAWGGREHRLEGHGRHQRVQLRGTDAGRLEYASTAPSTRTTTIARGSEVPERIAPGLELEQAALDHIELYYSHPIVAATFLPSSSFKTLRKKGGGRGAPG